MDKAKLKTILRWAGGGLLALLSVILLLAFLFTVAANRITAMDVVLMWVMILGLGAPGVLLLRKAILELKSKSGGEYDDEYGDEAEEEVEEEEDTEEE
ncbi:MAG: hypothetical protein FWC27_05255 [Firmicutes bacterium]|nr:hypothetical protein [Bacillota bacterium]